MTFLNCKLAISKPLMAISRASNGLSPLGSLDWDNIDRQRKFLLINLKLINWTRQTVGLSNPQMNINTVVSSLASLIIEISSRYPSRTILDDPHHVMDMIKFPLRPDLANTKYGKSAADVFFTAIAKNDMPLLERAIVDLSAYSADKAPYLLPYESCFHFAVETGNLQAASLLVQGKQVRLPLDIVLNIVGDKREFLEILFKSGWIFAQALEEKNMDMAETALAYPTNSVNYWGSSNCPPFSRIMEISNRYPSRKILSNPNDSMKFILSENPGGACYSLSDYAADVFFTAVAINDMPLLERSIVDLKDYAADKDNCQNPEESCFHLAVETVNLQAASLLLHGRQVRMTRDAALKIVDGKAEFRELLFKSGWMFAKAVEEINTGTIKQLSRSGITEMYKRHPTRKILTDPTSTMESIVSREFSAGYPRGCAANVFFTAIAINDMPLLKRATFELSKHDADEYFRGIPQVPGESCLNLAVETDNMQAASLLLHGKQVRMSLKDALKIVDGKAKFLDLLFKSGWILAKAVDERNFDMIQKSLADPENSTEYMTNEYSPLFKAIWWDQFKAAKLLIKHGAATTLYGRDCIETALSFALKSRFEQKKTICKEGNHKFILNLICNRQFDPNERLEGWIHTEKFLMTPLAFAIQQRDARLFDLLVECGADTSGFGGTRLQSDIAYSSLVDPTDSKNTFSIEQIAEQSGFPHAIDFFTLRKLKPILRALAAGIAKNVLNPYGLKDVMASHIIPMIIRQEDYCLTIEAKNYLNDYVECLLANYNDTA